MEPVSDIDLVGSAQRGEEEAFEALFERHRRWVYALCLRMSRSATEAEDLVQDAFLQLFRRISTFRGESSFSTWFHRLVINTVLMHLRRRSSELARFSSERQEGGGSASEEYGMEDLGLRSVIDRVSIGEALSRLPQSYRAVVLLHDVEGYRHEEIVRPTQGSVGTSKSQLHRAHVMLRKLLGDHRAGALRTAAGAS